MSKLQIRRGMRGVLVFVFGCALLGCAVAPVDPTDSNSELADSEASGPRKLALIVGGASSVDTPFDLFGGWMAAEASALDALGYETRVLFSDGLADIPAQADALAKLSARPGGRPAAFSSKNLTTELKRLVDHAGVGDQVLLVIATHGFACSGWEPPPGSDPNVAGPEDFCVALGTPKPESGYTELRFDDLRPTLAALEQRGAWTGILVSTCDAGNAVRVAGPRTCVLTATGYETSRRTAFFWSWLDHTAGGMTLRQAYRRTLPYTNDYDQCQTGCADDPSKLCPAPCSYYDTPWLSAEKGYPDPACDAFVL